MAGPGISYAQWLARYGVPTLPPAFRDDSRAPDWSRQRFAIREGVPLSDGVLQPGELLAELTRCVNPRPLLLATIRFPISEERLATLNAADDRQLEWLWCRLCQAGARVVICAR
jgi:hypothetical protein